MFWAYLCIDYVDYHLLSDILSLPIGIEGLGQVDRPCLSEDLTLTLKSLTECAWFRAGG